MFRDRDYEVVDAVGRQFKAARVVHLQGTAQLVMCKIMKTPSPSTPSFMGPNDTDTDCSIEPVATTSCP